MLRSVLFGLVQLAGGVAALVGLYLLAGLEWSLLLGGVVVAALATLAELAGLPRGPLLPEPPED